MTSNNNKRKFKPGQLVVAQSHAGVDVKIRLTRKDEQGLGWFGVLIDQKDAMALKNAGVPWIEPEEFETFTYHHQIVKLVYQKRNHPRSNKKNGSRIIRKPKIRKR